MSLFVLVKKFNWVSSTNLCSRKMGGGKLTIQFYFFYLFRTTLVKRCLTPHFEIDLNSCFLFQCLVHWKVSPNLLLDHQVSHLNSHNETPEVQHKVIQLHNLYRFKMTCFMVEKPSSKHQYQFSVEGLTCTKEDLFSCKSELSGRNDNRSSDLWLYCECLFTQGNHKVSYVGGFLFRVDFSFFRCPLVRWLTSLPWDVSDFIDILDVPGRFVPDVPPVVPGYVCVMCQLTGV